MPGGFNATESNKIYWAGAVPKWPQIPDSIQAEMKKIHPDADAEHLARLLDLNRSDVQNTLSRIRKDYLDGWNAFTQAGKALLDNWKFKEADILSTARGLSSTDLNERRRSMNIANEYQMGQIRVQEKLGDLVTQMEKAADSSLSDLNAVLNHPVTKAWIQYHQTTEQNLSKDDESDVSRISAAANRTIYIAAEYLNSIQATALDLKYLGALEIEFMTKIAKFYRSLYSQNEVTVNREYVKLRLEFEAFKRRWINDFININFHPFFMMEPFPRDSDTGTCSIFEWYRGPLDHQVQNYPVLGKKVIQLEPRPYDKVLVGFNLVHYYRDEDISVEIAAELKSGPLTLKLKKLPKHWWINFGGSYLPLYSRPADHPTFTSTEMRFAALEEEPRQPDSQRKKTRIWRTESPFNVETSQVVTWFTATYFNTTPNVRIAASATIKSRNEVELSVWTWWNSKTPSASVAAILLPKDSLESWIRCGREEFSLPKICSSKSIYVRFSPPFPENRAEDIRVMAAFSGLDLERDPNEKEVCVRICTTGVSEKGFYLHFNSSFKTIAHKIFITWVAAMQ